jgi:hypothetical protein
MYTHCLLMKLRRPSEALNEYEASQQREPQRFRGLQGAGQATTTLFMIAFHVGAVAGLFFFSWNALAQTEVGSRSVNCLVRIVRHERNDRHSITRVTESCRNQI